MWQTKYASAVPKNLEVGVDFWPCSEGDFLTGRPVVRGSDGSPLTKKGINLGRAYRAMVSAVSP